MIAEETHCPNCHAGFESLEPIDAPKRLPDGWDLEVIKCIECELVFSCAQSQKGIPTRFTGWLSQDED
jgi:hypothetical protein